jgi:hypothetical protein
MTCRKIEMVLQDQTALLLPTRTSFSSGRAGNNVRKEVTPEPT